MEKLTMCRICLVKDVEMYVVDNENMQKIYEELTDIPFVTDDRRPMLACDFCYAQLNQCCQLVSKCLEAEEVFAQMLNEGCKQNPSGFKGNLEFSGGLFKTPIPMTIDEVCQKESGANTAQEPAVSDIEDNIVVKKEYPSEIVGSSAIKEQLPAVCDTEDNIIIKKEFPSENVQSAEQVLAVCDIENNIEIRKECPSETAESGTTAEQEPAVCDMEDDIVVKKVYPSEIVGSNAITEQLPAVCDIEDDNEIKNTEQLPSVCGIEDNIVVKKEYPDPKITEQEPAVCDIEGDIEIKKEIEIAESSPVTEQLPSVCGIGDNIKIKEEYTSENSAITEQGELPAVCDLKDDIDFEEEYPSDELGAQAFTLPLVFEPDTEECLMNLQSVKKEQDVPEETSDLSSEHYVLCFEESEESKNNPNNNKQEYFVNKTQNYYVKGPPIRKCGRPKKPENFSSEQVYQPYHKHRKTFPETFPKRAEACYTAKYRDGSRSALLLNNEVAIPATPSVCLKTYTHKSATPSVKTYRPKHATSLVSPITCTPEHTVLVCSMTYTKSAENDGVLSQKDIIFYPPDSSRKRKKPETPEEIREYSRERKRLSRSKDDVRIRERIRNRLSKRLQKAQICKETSK